MKTGRLAGRPAASREPLARAERLHLALLAGVFALVAAVLGANTIALNNLSGQILGLQEQMGDLRAELHEEIGKLSDRMDQLSERLTRVETLIETRLVPSSNARSPAGP